MTMPEAPLPWSARLLAAGMAVVVAGTLGALGAPAALAYTASLDPTFSGDGLASLSNTFVGAVATSAGSTYVLGEYVEQTARPERLYRLAPDGSLDTGFGTGGFFGTSSATYWVDLSVDPQGRTLLVGQSRRNVTLVRVTAQGTRDDSFGRDGSVRIGDRRTTALTLTRDRQGRVLVLTGQNHGTRQQLRLDTCVTRLLPGGRPDRSFGPGGTSCVDVARNERPFALTVDGRDRPLVTGGGARTSPRTWVLRLRAASGRSDRSFGSSRTGVVSVRFGSRLQSVGAAVGVSGRSITVGLAVQPGTRPLGSGRSLRAGALRLTSSGRIDTGYGSRGRAVLPSYRAAALGVSLFIDSDGRAVAVGQSNGTSPGALVGALTRDGGVDTGISPTGWALVPGLTGDSFSVDATAGNGRLIVVGTALRSTTFNGFVAAFVA
jgi:uncharacterized delta-60 repeat protein